MLSLDKSVEAEIFSDYSEQFSKNEIARVSSKVLPVPVCCNIVELEIIFIESQFIILEVIEELYRRVMGATDGRLYSSSYSLFRA